MSSEAVNFILDEFSITDDVFKIYYNFENYSGDYILSSPNADPTYSGRIYGNMTQFTGASGSGDFTQGYIKVQHANQGLNSGVDGSCAFVFSSKKANTQPGVVFSNFGKTGDFTNYYTPPSGWEIGFNQANKLYFRNYDSLAPTIHTLNSIPTAENIYAVTLQLGNLGLWHYDAVNSIFESKMVDINQDFIRPSYDWYIGTGEYQYSGYMDEFLYFSDALDSNSLATVTEGIFQTLSITTGMSGVVSGGVTGYEETPTGETGIIAYTGLLSGVVDFTGSGINSTGTGLTGYVSEGETYYQLIESTQYFLDNNYPFQLNLYSGVVATSGGNYVTGFSTGASGFQVTGSREVYTTSGITGTLSSGTGFEPLYGLIYYLGTGAATGLAGGSTSKYLPDSVFYIGQRGDSSNVLNGETGDFVEIISEVSPLLSNQMAGFGYSNTFHKNLFFVKSGENPSLFFNGLQQFEGVARITEDELYEETIHVTGGDFFQSGFVLFENTFLASSPSFNSEEVICDVNQTGQKARLAITGSGQYQDSPFSEVSPDDTQLFFNGQKIYSGIDYVSIGGLFQPTGTIVEEGLTGFFTTLPFQATQIFTTGINVYDKNFGGSVPLNSLIYYINGVRQNPDQFIQHSEGVDLIQTGVNIMEGIGSVVYNINRESRIEYSDRDYWNP